MYACLLDVHDVGCLYYIVWKHKVGCIGITLGLNCSKGYKSFEEWIKKSKGSIDCQLYYVLITVAINSSCVEVGTIVDHLLHSGFRQGYMNWYWLSKDMLSDQEALTSHVDVRDADNSCCTNNYDSDLDKDEVNEMTGNLTFR